MSEKHSEEMLNYIYEADSQVRNSRGCSHVENIRNEGGKSAKNYNNLYIILIIGKHILLNLMTY